METNEAIERVRQYNQTLQLSKCSSLEKAYIQQINERQYFFGFSIGSISMPRDVDRFLKQHHDFQGLLVQHHQKLCHYLQVIQQFTCHHQLVRMDARSQNFSYYEGKVKQAIGAFYLFYGAGLDMKELVYGQYRQLFYHFDFSPVIAIELLENNAEVIQYCYDVLTSDNNTALITRDVIKAIEQSHHQGLQDMLIQVFLAAKLQEGLRQAVIETIDEHQLDYFIRMIEVIQEHQLLRYSSIQRGVLTWIGLGYDVVDERHISHIFACINDYLHHEDHRQAALYDENPLHVYIALYCLGVRDVDTSIDEACALLNQKQHHIVASALVYLKLSHHFDICQYSFFMEQYQDDEWILALYYQECTRHDFSKLSLTDKQRHDFFQSIYHQVTHMKAKQTFSSKGFEWYFVTLSKAALTIILFELIDGHPETSMVDAFLPFVSSTLSYDRLKRFMKECFPHASMSHKKAFMLKEIISNNEQLSQYISEEYQKLTLTQKDILQLEERLKTKKAYARAHIINVIACQSQDVIQESYERLHSSPLKTIQESAIELQQKVPQYFQKVQVIKIKGKEEGFGLYSPRHIYSLPYVSQLTYQTKGLLKKSKVLDLSFLHVWNQSQILEYIQLWNQRIEAHASDEYLYHGQYYSVGYEYFYPLDYREYSLNALPLSKVWRDYFAEDHLSDDVLFQLQFIHMSIGTHFETFLENDIHLIHLLQRDVEHFPYFGHFQTIFKYYFLERKNPTFTKKAAQCLEMFNHHCQYLQYRQLEYTFSNQQQYGVYSIASLSIVKWLIECLDLFNLSDEDFQKYFPVLYESYVQFHLSCDASTKQKLLISPLVLSRAVVLKLLPQEALLEGLLDTHYQSADGYRYGQREHMLFEAYRDAYFKGRGISGKPCFDLPSQHQDVYIHLRKTLDDIADHLLTMETARLNEKTPVTDYIDDLYVIRGMKSLILALHVLDHEDIKRQSYGDDRRSIFTFVIKHTYPLESDDYHVLENEHFSEKRLVEVAMMAPQWIDMINQVLKWDGFKEACYYFIAHMKQYDDQQKKAEIVKYTDIDPTDLNDGAFDMDWCQNIYHTLGDQRMQMIYQSAQFLCDNAFHTRARKYADACLQKTRKEVFYKQVVEKRNKDALSAYCICPLQDDQDLMERYLFVQKFIKESKQFGAQRQASEKRAGEIALMNLARNSRFETVTRLSWMMESEAVNQYSYVLNPQHIGDVEVWINIDDQGKNEICVRKNGKKQKSIPAKLKKNEAIVEIKNIHTLWNEQYRRSRKMLEKAMEERVIFTAEEIHTIMKNPIVSPMLKKLVLKSDDHFGFYQNGYLQGIDDIYEIQGDLSIAHPYDMYQYQVWHEYQKYIFEKQIVQPFQQVFRELYLKLEDEQAQSMTKRYTGYQIQIKKAVGALKNRQWNVSYENGLERVYHRENVIVRLLADADWFSPSDIETPSIDYVTFTSLKDNQPMKIKDIDDVLFSETMRDVDLAVSTAYVGGVDPVTSFSTIQLRKTIVEYTCSLMKLSCVEVQDHFVIIHGQINDYSVHLGSGMVHQSGGGSIHIVPVYSGKRGKVYLPFLDEDPMMAQIISKVIMLAQDNKIKDPSILNQIVSRNP